MASLHSLPYLVALATTFSIVILCSLSLIEASNDGFSVELMHRDSPKSPFYDPSETPQQRLANTLRRSHNRVNHFRSTSSFSTNEVSSEIVSDGGEFLMQYAVGTPPVKVLGIADTGSDLTWLQCAPCTECYKQKDPIFNPAKSSTYKTVPCTAPQCRTASGNCLTTKCQYRLVYGDGSVSKGDVALDTVTLGTATFPQTVIGCGHANTGIFGDKGSGIVGLGNSANSLVSQLSTSIAGKFSYCLVPFEKPAATSKLNFGTNAVVSGPGAVTTPLATSKSDVFYTLTLEAISIGPTRITPISAKPAEGNIIIDSGTTLTVLPTNLYTGFEAALKAQIKLPVVKQLEGESPNLCFYSPESTFKVPTIRAHFTGGADVTLSAPYTFLGNETVTCMAFTASDDLAIFGNLAQTDLLVGYDIVKQTLSFKPTDCTKA